MSGDVTSDVFHGSSRLRSTTSTSGQPARSSSIAGRASRSPTAARPLTVGHGDTSSTGAPARRRPLDDHVAGVPRRAALLLQRLVVLVDDDGGGEVRARRPRRDARPDHHVDAGRRSRPLLRAHGDAEPGAPQAGGVEPGAVGRRHDDQHRPATGGGQQRRQHVVGRRHPHRAATRRQQARRGSAGRLRPRTRAAARRQPGHVRRRAGGHEERPQPPGGPTDRRPAGELDQPAVRTPRADLGDRPQALDVERPVGRIEGHDPAADAPAVERDAHPRPEVDVEHQPLGHDVVELLVQPGHVGEHPGDARAPGAGALRRRGLP